MKCSVIGIGTVGYPLYKALEYYHGKENVHTWDLNKNCNDWGDILTSDITFICVPTSSKEDGRLDMSNVEQNLEKLNDCNYKGVTVIKSTLGLGYINEAEKRFEKLRIIVFPEWLYANKAFAGTLSPEVTVVGFNPGIDEKALNTLIHACCWIDWENANFVGLEEAVMTKLTANSLATVKISFANQIQLICEKYNIDVVTVMEIIKTDPRCSPRYLSPGSPFGGHCLPKDMSELANCIEDCHLLKATKKVNDIMEEKVE